MSSILLDTIDFDQPISSYIDENNRIHHGEPSLLKFITSEKKDFNDTMNKNKQRILKDNVTDAFVQTFFTNDEDITKMLVDYQYHFLHYKIMNEINISLLNTRIPNRNGVAIDGRNLHPLKHNEHIILNFKGGSTMYYLFKNIITSIDITEDIVNQIRDNFKISDIDLSLTIETEDNVRYYQIESIITQLVIKYMEELTNRFECILLKTVTNNSPEINQLINDNRYINRNNVLEVNNITIIENPQPIFPSQAIYLLKYAINNYKLKFNPELILNADPNVQRDYLDDIVRFYKQFANFDENNPVNFEFKTLDILELTLLLEFVTYVGVLNYNRRIRFLVDFQAMTLLYSIKIKRFIDYLLNNRYMYLLNNLYSEEKLRAFIQRINDNLINVNNSLINKAITSYNNENAAHLFRPRECNNPIIHTANGDYYNEYKYLYETKSGMTSYYNIPTNDNIIPNNINIEGRPNFALIPQDNSFYPYLLVSSDNLGENHENITGFKTRLGNVPVNLNGLVKNFDYTRNRNNVHYVALNKSIMTLDDNGFLLAFNLCRIKFNVTVSNIIQKVNVEDNNCPAANVNSYSIPSEFLDVSINTKFDSFHNVTKEIEEHNRGMIFNFSMPENPGFEYGSHSRIMSYNLKTFAADLNNILFNQQKIPWLDNKYSKRLLRLMFYLFNVQHKHYMENQVTNIFSRITNQITILNNFINSLDTNIDTNKFTPENIINGNNAVITIEDNGRPLDFQQVVNQFIDNLSIPNTIIYINSDNIIDIILSNKTMSEFLMLKSIYKYGDGFYTFTIIYIMVIYKLSIDMNDCRNRNLGDIARNKIINKYADIIKILYNNSGITFDISYYGDIGDGTNQQLIIGATNRMNLIIVNNFIIQVGLYVRNIKENIAKLIPIFRENFQYNNYEFIPV